jgi:NADPH:quinone reductase-like Zn-dependent oxidoreductase
MEAIRIHKFGGPDVLQREDVDKPVPAGGEMLVQVMAASVNPVDFKIREGNRGDESALPMTLGRDLAGVVEQVGNEVSGFAVGDDIFALLGHGRGAYAEYVLVLPQEAAPKPGNLSYVEAAAVPLVALTAWQGIFDHGGLEAGQRLLVHGGAGGVGHMAVQLAKARGAWVAATAAGEDLDFLRSIGADQAIDYQTQRFEDEVSDIDVVFDLVAGETQARSWAVLKPGGIIVSTLTEPPQDEARRRGMRGTRYVAEANGPELLEIARLIEEGKVRPRVQSTFPLDRAAEAQEALEHGHTRGKIVLEA